MQHRVVFTGLGCLTPIGNTLEEAWNSVLHVKSGTARVTQVDPKQFNCKVAAEVKNFEPLKYLSAKQIKKSDLPSRVCEACNRPFKWRKKWERVWDEVKYCSDRCRNNRKNIVRSACYKRLRGNLSNDCANNARIPSNQTRPAPTPHGRGRGGSVFCDTCPRAATPMVVLKRGAKKRSR